MAENNPAGRLLQILEKMRQQQLRGQPSRKAWAQILNVEETNLTLLFRKIGDVASLIETTRKSAERLEGIDSQHLISWIPKFLRPWENFNFGAAFEHFTGPVDETMLALLRICDDMMSRQLSEPTVQSDQLKKWQDDIAALTKEISDSALEEGFKRYLFRYLDVLENAIADYRIKGFESLREGLEQCIGIYQLSEPHHHDLQSTAEGSKVMKLLGMYAIVITAAVGTLQLPQEIKKYLPDHGSASQTSVQSHAGVQSQTNRN